MADSNRRKHARVKPKQLVTRVRAGGDLHIGLGIENISLGGLFVKLNRPLPVGAEVTLELARPGASQPLVIGGKVTSTVSLAKAEAQGRSAGMGIAFDALPPHLQQRLEGLVGAIDPSAVAAPVTARGAPPRAGARAPANAPAAALVARAGSRAPANAPLAATVPRVGSRAPANAPAAPAPPLPSALRITPARVDSVEELPMVVKVERTEVVEALVARSPDELRAQVAALTAQLAERNRKVKELLAENRELWERLRTAEG